MTFIKMLIGLPLLAVLFTFAFINNDLATFNFWPFDFEVTVSLSVAIVFLFVTGFLFGNFFSWISYAPRIRKQRKENKKLNKVNNKLSEKVSGLKDNIENLKSNEAECPKASLKDKIKDFFKKKEVKE